MPELFEQAVGGDFGLPGFLMLSTGEIRPSLTGVDRMVWPEDPPAATTYNGYGI